MDALAVIIGGILAAAALLNQLRLRRSIVRRGLAPAAAIRGASAPQAGRTSGLYRAANGVLLVAGMALVVAGLLGLP